MTYNGQRLRIARLFKEWTQRDLADRIAVSHTLIGDFENATKEPKGDVLEALCAVLGIEPTFLFNYDEDEFREEESNFRRRIIASERFKKKVLAHATLFGIAVRYLRRHVRFPDVNIPDITPASLDDIERVAAACRAHWDLGQDTPIHSMNRILENAGVLLVRADIETATRVDAFSRFGDVSVVVLNSEKGSPSRTFFDTAHETGHGVMHKTRRPPIEQREAEADRFASAFLLPREAFAREFREAGRSDWEFYFELKSRWGTSVQAIVVRAYQLGLVDAAEYRRRFRDISRHGWRTSEPSEPDPDEPQLFRLALDRYQKDTGHTTRDLATALGWSAPFFTSVTGALAEEAHGPSIVSLDEYKQRQMIAG